MTARTTARKKMMSHSKRTPDSAPVPDPELAPPRTEAEIVADIRSLNALDPADSLARAENDRRIGALYIEAEPFRAASGLLAEDWCRDRLGMRLRRVQECAKLAHRWEAFSQAHAWFTGPDGEAAGWIVDNKGRRRPLCRRRSPTAQAGAGREAAGPARG